MVDDDVIGKAYDARLMRRLSVYARPYLWLVAAAVGCLMVDGLMALVGPIMTQRVIDVALPSRNLALVWQSAAILAVSLVFAFACQYGETILTSLLGQRVMRDLRGDIFRHVQSLPVTFFDRNPVGRRKFAGLAPPAPPRLDELPIGIEFQHARIAAARIVSLRHKHVSVATDR